MSYDIQFGVKVEGAENTYAVIGHPEDDSPTYNLGNMFRIAMNWHFKQGEWYRLVDVLPSIASGISELTLDQGGKYSAMNPSNGWGTREGAIRTLQSIVSWINDLQYSDNSSLPKECIYIRW